MAKETTNDYGMPEAELHALVKREKERKEKMLRDRVAYKLLVKKAKDAGLTPTKEEIDAEIARLKA